MEFAEPPLTYSGGWLDRAGALRTDPGRLAAALSGPIRVVPLWRDRTPVVVDPPAPVRLVGDLGRKVLDEIGEHVFLGLDDQGAAVLAVDLSPLPEAEAVALTGAGELRDVRTLAGTLDAAEAAVQAYARGILHWHRHHGFCGSCGARTEVREAGHVRRCPATGCERLHFPRIEPAVIVLVEAPGTPWRCLLARHKGASAHGWSTLAGFVEIGESLEDAVRREVAEEAGVQVGGVTYQASQAWPFPSGIMLGFRASAASDDIQVDGEELEDARWFTPDELRGHVAAGHRLGRVDSIDRHLLTSWLDERG